jgi:hypothetical protein
MNCPAYTPPVTDTWRQDVAHRRQMSAHCFINASLPNDSHESAQDSQTSAQTPQTRE